MIDKEQNVSDAYNELHEHYHPIVWGLSKPIVSQESVIPVENKMKSILNTKLPLWTIRKLWL